MFPRWLFNQGGLSQHSQKDHSLPETTPHHVCTHHSSHCQEGGGVEEDHERRWWNPEGRSGNARLNFFSAPAGMMLSPKHLRGRRSETKGSGARMVVFWLPGRTLRNKKGFGTEALMSSAKSGGHLCFPTFRYVRITKSICLKSCSWILLLEFLIWWVWNEIQDHLVYWYNYFQNKH